MPRRVVARRGPGLREVGFQPLGAHQAPNRLARRGEVGPARLDLVVAALRILVAERHEGRLAAERSGQGIGDEQRRLGGHVVHGRRGGIDAERSGSLGIEPVRQEVARHDGEV